MYEYDNPLNGSYFLMNLQNALDSIGISIWPMIIVPSNILMINTEPKSQHLGNSCLNDKIHNHDNDDHENGSIDSSALSVAWIADAKRIYSGSSNGCPFWQHGHCCPFCANIVAHSSY
uniref:Uncharacterized protein MANES_02G183600 n=2 Tax=Rhizophora mucronata TaxID=61149 RepID=A0A2P2LVA6_RHIMU